MNYNIPSFIFRIMGGVPSPHDLQDLSSLETSTATDTLPAVNLTQTSYPPQTVPIPIQKQPASPELIQYSIPSYYMHDSISAFSDASPVGFVSDFPFNNDTSRSFETCSTSPAMGVGTFGPMSPISMDEQYQHKSFYLPSSYSSSATTTIDSPPAGSYDKDHVLVNQQLFTTAGPKPDLLSTPTVRHRSLHRCPYCAHVSNRGNNMKEHILTHDPNRPKKFKCDVCSKLFARKHDMRRHVRTHERRRRLRNPTSPEIHTC